MLPQPRALQDFVTLDLEEADKLKLEVNPVCGKAVDTLVGELYRTPKDVMEETRKATTP